MGKIRPMRMLVQFCVVLISLWILLNACYLSALADQEHIPSPLLSSLADSGLFVFASENGALSIEDFCPFGPVEGVVRFAQTTAKGEGFSFIGPVTLRNLALLLSVFVLCFVTKKTFCSWLCPFGAIFEALEGLGKRLGLPRWEPPASVRDRLALLRYASLALVVGITTYSGTLLFKEVDPFFTLFSFGLETRSLGAYVLLGSLLSGALFVPGLWCRYLCPMSAVLDPIARLGFIRVTRTGHCVGCKQCTRHCPQGIQVHILQKVRTAACTNCLTCLDRCPQQGALELRLEVIP